MSGEFSIAVHALVYLYHKNITLSSEALAENICTNPARVRKVMGMLKRARLVCTKEGAEGGYHFCLNPAEVTLRQVDEAVGVPLVAASWRSGSMDMDCLVASGMGRIMDSIYADLNEQCRRRLDEITILDISNQIFGADHA